MVGGELDGTSFYLHLSSILIPLRPPAGIDYTESSQATGDLPFHCISHKIDLIRVRPETPFFWKTGRLTFECNMRVSCFHVRKAKFSSCCEWEREFRQFLDEQIRMIT